MTLEVGLNSVMEKIPDRSTHSENATLQIIIPSNYGIISENELMMLVSHASSKGWNDKNIEINHKSGYIICDKCSNKLHVHIAKKDAVFCMSCGHSINHDLNKTQIFISE